MNARQRLTVDATPRQVPALALKAPSVAAALDISLTTFLTLVEEGKMPKPVSIPGHRGLVLYDFESVRNAWEALKESGADGEANPWDKP